MTPNHYQMAAMRTANRGGTSLDNPIIYDAEQKLLNFSLGMCGESGEFADMIKKHVFHGHAMDVPKLKRELGDVLWYVATLSDTLGFTLEDVMQTNIEKLKERYPQGFTSEDSIARKDTK